MKAIERSFVRFDACGMDKPSRSGQSNERGNASSITPFISIQESLFTFDKLQFNDIPKERFTHYYLSADLAAKEYRKRNLLCILKDDLHPKAYGFRKYVE